MEIGRVILYFKKTFPDKTIHGRVQECSPLDAEKYRAEILADGFVEVDTAAELDAVMTKPAA